MVLISYKVLKNPTMSAIWVRLADFWCLNAYPWVLKDNFLTLRKSQSGFSAEHLPSLLSIANLLKRVGLYLVCNQISFMNLADLLHINYRNTRILGKIRFSPPLMI